MRVISILILSFLIFIAPISSFGQQQDTAKLVKDPKEFANKIESMFKRVESKEREKILEAFLENWETNSFTVEEQNLIMELEELMDKNRFRPTGGYQTYIAALNASRNKGLSTEKFKEWHKILRKVVTDRRDFDQVNQMMIPLMNSNIIYKSRSKDWHVNKFQYDLTFDKKPYLIFKNKIKLYCITKGDTLAIYNTTGKLNILENHWEGNKGKITWERVKLSPDQVYANLGDYSMDLKPGELQDDSVEFYYKKLFEKPLVGRLHDKVSIASVGVNAQYPKFYSSKSSYTIDGFFKNITYVGGFAMEGRNVFGTGTEEQRALIKIFYNGQAKLRSRAQRFVIGTNTINATRTSTKIYFKGDSLYHGNIKFKYSNKERTVTLSKGSSGLTQSPFYDSYHRLQIDVDQVEWNIDKPKLYMDMTVNSVDPAVFRSDNFFQKGQFDKVQGILEYNPLIQLNAYAKRINSRRFTDQEIANYLGIPKDNMKLMLIRLGKQGFVNYQIEQGEVYLQNKLLHYVKAEKGLTDYDNLTFRSTISARKNAELNFNTGNLNLEGVGRASLSDSQNVYIFPKQQQLTIKKNRNLKFAGQMVAGRFHYFGEGFKFDYDSFKVDMNNIDSLRLYFPDEETGNLTKVNNVLQDISGSVFIDHPNNKSGKVPFPEYPIFDCEQEAAVYYDKRFIFNGVYNKDSFYFQVKPFVVDSLNNFTRKGIQFNGTFYSANILPVFDHALTLMKDNSLGFTKRPPPDGFPLYGGKGTGYVQIRLSNKGLWGAGKVKYLPSTTESQNFAFFPDSMNAHSESFTIPQEGQNKYPPVTGTQVYNHWMPYKDSMYIHEKEPLSVYTEDIKFKGDLILTPKELYGTGEINFKNAVINSKSLAMKPNNITSDSASFMLKSDEKDKPAFLAQNSSINFDLQSKKLMGSSNTEKALISFKKHQYKTSIQDYRWNIEDKSVYMTAPQGQKISEAFMLSTNPSQDSLQFNTTAAFFDLEKSIIEARNIPHIDIADAQIYPYEGEITIKENSEIRTLQNARIKADTNYFFHEFYDATINIFSGNKYAASGKYDYEDRNENTETIYFEEIRLDENGQTIAEGTIKDTADFHLSPRLQFDGKVSIKARRKELAFDGWVFPENVKPTLRTEEFKFTDTVYPDSIYIPVKNAKNKKGQQLYTGVFMNQAENEIYNLFMGQKKNSNDYPLFVAEGFLHYNYYTGKYIVEKWRNIKGKDPKKHRFTYSDQDHNIKTTGPVNLNFDNEYVTIRAAGNIIYNPSDTAHVLDIVMGLDFNFPPSAIQNAADSISNLAFYRPDTRDGRQVLKDAIYHIIENEKARNNIMNSLKSFDMMVTNEAYQPNFLFTQLKLVWAPGRKAFINKGNLGLGTMLNTSINKQLKGKFEYQTGIVPDHLKFFVSGTNGNYYYFNIGKEMCKVYASDIFFNEKVMNNAGDYSKGKFEIKLLRNAKEKIFFHQSFSKTEK